MVNIELQIAFSKSSCQICSKRHHTSICDEKESKKLQEPKKKTLMSARDGERVIHPVVVIEVNGVTCRALIDTGASSCYASAQLVDQLQIRPHDVNYK